MPQANPQVRSLLLPAYEPCASFRGDCLGMRWQPESGYVPRGFCGATGEISDVKLVLVTAEPGDPHKHEKYGGLSPDEMFDKAYPHAHKCLETEKDTFHVKIRMILGLCFPGESLNGQLRHTWITDSVLCSAHIESGSIPTCVANACRSRYLESQLSLFPDAVIATLGSKAKRRLEGHPREIIHARAAAPQGCFMPDAITSWKAIATKVREKFPLGSAASE